MQEDTKDMLKGILELLLNIEEFEAKGEIDFSYELPGSCRFRINAYHQQGQVSIAATND